MSNVRKILVCDDDTELRSALVEQLRLYDEFQIKEAETGTSAVQIAKNDHFDLLIMDVGLPDIDGREAVKILRKGGSVRRSSCSRGMTARPIPSLASKPVRTTISIILLIILMAALAVHRP